MFSDNPFSELAVMVPPAGMKWFVVVMAAFVVAGTLYDMWHKGSARYFFANWQTAGMRRTRRILAGEAASIAVRTALADALASGEFCNARRRVAHLLTMYGFLAYVITTVILVFGYSGPDTQTPVLLPMLWHVGALMVCLGCFWFWFFIRVDVVAEGKSPLRMVRADLFVLSLLANAALALVWSWLQSSGNSRANLCLVLYVVAAIVLFGSVAWSKFSHMFYKPAAAFQKRMEEADGSRSNLPLPASQPARLGSVRRQSNHY